MGNGNNPAQWQESPWQDNLALFTHDGISESIYSTSTVDVSVSGTSTIDCWAPLPGANWLRATRVVVVGGVANDNVAASVPAPQPSNDNSPLEELPATGTE
jgi:hypothetical protein